MATSDMEARKKALEIAMGKIEKKNGAGTIQYLGSSNRKVQVQQLGVMSLDIALGGGMAKGRIIEIYGPESSGKTSIALLAAAAFQQAGELVGFIDAEHALDPEWAKKIGVDISEVAFSQPDHGEQALDTLNTLVESAALGLIVVDSVAALTPKAEIEGEMSDNNVGLQARMMSKALRKITGAAMRNGTTIIFINQLREKIGVFFGSPETTTGGKALKFYASQRLDVRRIETLKEGTDPVGSRTRVKVVKNKVAPPFKQAEFDLMYAHAFSREGDILDLAVEHGFIKKSGAWYSDVEDGTQVGQGKENSRKFLMDNTDYTASIKAKLEEKLFPKVEEILDDVDPDFVPEFE